MTSPLPQPPSKPDAAMTRSTLEQAKDHFLAKGMDGAALASGRIRVTSLLYMVYWLHRLRNNPEEHASVAGHFLAYVDNLLPDPGVVTGEQDEGLVALASRYVQEDLVAVQTVDLVIERAIAGKDNDREVLLFERPCFPHGICLPGGLVEEADHANPFALDGRTFAALRIAAEKVLHVDLHTTGAVRISATPNGQPFYSVENRAGTKKVTLQPQDIHGYFVKENLHAVLRPSDPRHLVDTVGFRCEITDTTGDPEKEYFWEAKSTLLQGLVRHSSLNFAFRHHKEIIFHMLARTSVEMEMTFREADFVRKILSDPVGSHQKFMQRFSDNRFRTDTAFPELFPTVNHVLKSLFSEDLNTLCANHDILNGFRDKVANRLRHVSLKNRNFCPYLPTLSALFEGIAFFDVAARMKKDFYTGLPTDRLIEHNPKEKENAAYHTYKYRYRMDELLSRIPDEIIIPTFATLSATDLMRARGVPLRFVGLSTDFIYVDEFEQSPEEFLLHDVNHSYRMMQEDQDHRAREGLSAAQLATLQTAFIGHYLAQIKLSPGDTEKTRELKKIKKIILFEVVHEEAKPFLPDVILASIVKKEGGETRFEMPVVDEKTGYLDIVDVVDTEINTLSYVRNKLQHGFYDRADKQSLHIVSPDYRKSAFIAEAAMEMVCELSAFLGKAVEVDYAYLLQRTCSAGPDNIHDTVLVDDDLPANADGVRYLNPKRYLSNQTTA
jgi:hypothetical protein